MRNEGIPKFLFIAGAILIVLMTINVFTLHSVRRQYAPASRINASLFDFVGQTKEWFDYFYHWKDLASENEKLRNQLAGYTAIKATVGALQIENDDLKKISGISKRLDRHLLPAGIFDFYLAPDGYSALINKGSLDKVSVGQTVISLNNEIMGRVTAVFPNSSKVILVMDPSFTVTGKVLGGQTSGIVHGALVDGLNFDLVTQADSVSEGDVIVTTGNDMIPAGLVIGVVRVVENNDTQLFKKVSIKPAIQLTQGSVVVVQ
ncbi:MAG: rod shape-determining protein MreC [Candidatus Pacebacteria bacterium]|nr:rod shape-determining protein MreC [Candidatus Paceibacterota bacterium]